MRPDQDFRKVLTERQKEVDSVVCVGFDPLTEKMPGRFRFTEDGAAEEVLEWMISVADEVAPYTSMFKPQHAYWEAIEGGVTALQQFNKYVRINHPKILNFGDCKRGDIDRTQAQYAKAHFDIEGFDGMNYNGYMGRKTLEKLIDPKFPGRGLVGLGRTSNPEAWEIQDQPVHGDEDLWEFMVRKQYKWSETLGVLKNAGIVMGAAYERNPGEIYFQHLITARSIVGNNMWFLIPGFGTQGGCIEETVSACFWGAGSMVGSSSSQIIFAKSPGEAAMNFRDKLQAAGAQCK